MKKLWLHVTTDRYELPLAVCDSAAELARTCHDKLNNVHTAVYHHKKRGGDAKSKYITVEVEDD